MKQRGIPIVVIALILAAGCDRAKPSTSTGGIVSLSPAATDLILAMGAADQLSGVSTFDSDPRVASLPRVGDYENVDWERIQTLAPKLMITQMAPDRMPAGFVERARALNIALHSARIDRFADIIAESEMIGIKIGRADDARKMWHGLRDALDEVQTRTKGKPRVRTLIVTSDDGLGAAGPDTFLDDMLVAAGGENVMGNERPGYRKVDRELLLTLTPDAIVQFLPAATPAQLEAARAAWSALGDLPAVKQNRILTITDPWSLQPNSHVGELTRRIADHLHPEAR